MAKRSVRCIHARDGRCNKTTCPHFGRHEIKKTTVMKGSKKVEITCQMTGRACAFGYGMNSYCE